MTIFYDYVLIPFFIHTITYWICSGIFFIADYYTLPSSQLASYPKAIKTSLYNQFIVGLPIQYVLQYPLHDAIESTVHDSLFVLFIKTLCILMVSNVLFYVIHRCLHTRFLYYSIHYRHHEYIEPIAVATSYSHPIEYALLHILFFYVPCIWIGISYSLFLFLIWIGTIHSILAHTTYLLWYDHNDHIEHHKYYYVYFGFGSIMDRLCGTIRVNSIKPLTS
jgi:sterol desaturase/sphingolipid hydroxylase (fatty acid hydroxylase superfamily)